MKKTILHLLGLFSVCLFSSCSTNSINVSSSGLSLIQVLGFLICSIVIYELVFSRPLRNILIPDASDEKKSDKNHELALLELKLTHKKETQGLIRTTLKEGNTEQLKSKLRRDHILLVDLLNEGRKMAENKKLPADEAEAVQLAIKDAEDQIRSLAKLEI